MTFLICLVFQKYVAVPNSMTADSVLYHIQTKIMLNMKFYWTNTACKKKKKPTVYKSIAQNELLQLGYTEWWKRNTISYFTCIALFPSLTTSNKVTGSPSPFCWGWPLALPRLAPLAPASKRPLSPGDFRGFLAADWAKKTSRVKKKIYYSCDIWHHSKVSL